MGNRTANDIVRGIFANCTSLKKVTFETGSKLTILPTYCFYGCTALTTITIPASVTQIGHRAFEKSGITTVNFENSSGWKVYQLTSFSNQITATGFQNLGTGTAVIVSNASDAATNLKSTYIKYIWVRS